MWVAIILGGWLATSLLLGPWVGRFVSAHAKLREKPMVSKTVVPDDPAGAGKPIRMARRA